MISWQLSIFRSFTTHCQQIDCSLVVFIKENSEFKICYTKIYVINTTISCVRTVYVPLSCFCAFLARFSSNSRRLLVTDSMHLVRSLVARLLLVTGSHVRTLLHRVLLVTAPTKDPSIFPQSRRKFSPRLYLSLYRVRLLCRAQLSPAT